MWPFCGMGFLGRAGFRRWFDAFEDELDEELDADESRRFFDFFLLLSAELTLLKLTESSSSFLLSFFAFFFFNFLRKSKPLKPREGSASSGGSFFSSRLKSASNRRMLSIFRCALRSFFCSLWIFLVKSLLSVSVIFLMFFCFLRSSRCVWRSSWIWRRTSSFCLIFASFSRSAASFFSSSRTFSRSLSMRWSRITRQNELELFKYELIAYLFAF